MPEEATQTQEAPQEDNIVELVKPSSDPVEVTLSLVDEERKFIQKPLTFFNKLEFFSSLAEALDVAMQTGLSVGSLIDGTNPSSLNDADSFVFAIAKLTRYSPDLMKDCFCVWLDVPFDQRQWAKEAMDELSDDASQDIIETFIDQNFEDIDNFFRKRITKIREKINDHRKPDTSQTSSSNSKTTRRTTRKVSKNS